ncbi:hypothetical protein P7K49_021189, partial [Saguinus oedipus]
EEAWAEPASPGKNPSPRNCLLHGLCSLQSQLPPGPEPRVPTKGPATVSWVACQAKQDRSCQGSLYSLLSGVSEAHQ